MTQSTFSLSAVKPQIAAVPEPARGRAAGHNPALTWLQESYDAVQANQADKAGRAVDAPDIDAARIVYSAIRNAANRLKVGARVTFQDPRGKTIVYLPVPAVDKTGVPVMIDVLDKGKPTGEKRQKNIMTFLKTDKDGKATTGKYIGPVKVLFQAQKRQERAPVNVNSDTPNMTVDESQEARDAATGSEQEEPTN